jgi:hypothetical protein
MIVHRPALNRCTAACGRLSVSSRGRSPNCATGGSTFAACLFQTIRSDDYSAALDDHVHI